MFRRCVIILALLILMASANCLGETESWPTHGWTTATPEEQGMDSAALASMLGLINKQKAAIDSVVIVRHGRMVLESYRYPNTPGSKHVLNSCTKSVVSALLGIAIKEGRIKDVDMKVGEFFPETQYKLGEGMADLSIRYLLTMSSGMDWMEVPNSISTQEMTTSRDWTRYILESSIDTTPGTHFNYNSGGSHLLSAIITKATGRSALDYGREKLFGPLGIKELEWDQDPQKISIGGWGLKMLPTDMAKIGYLYLKKGRWEGGEILPKEWVAESTRKHMSTKGSLGLYGYGYQWWMTEYGGFYALGYAGQYIFVVPERELVVVFASSLKVDMQMPETLMKEYILPSIKSDQPLTPNPSGTAELNGEISILAQAY